jgi:hypothetical protein
MKTTRRSSALSLGPWGKGWESKFARHYFSEPIFVRFARYKDEEEGGLTSDATLRASSHELAMHQLASTR